MFNFHEFLDKFPIFTHEEFKQYAVLNGTTNLNTQREILAYHLKEKNIIRIRRGLFACIPISSRSNANSFSVDPYLIAGRISEDAILAYHTAFDFYGLSHSIFNQYIFLTQHKIRRFTFQQAGFIGLPFPLALVKKNNVNTLVETHDRDGLIIRVTSLERTIVDVLDRPEYAGGWEEIWRSAEHIPILNFDKVIQYAVLIENATTVAKLGFFLEQHKKQFNVDEKLLNLLETKKPRGIHYLDRNKRESGKLIRRWNLVVPTQIIDRTWEEPNNDLV